MNGILFVFLGGGAGSLARYGMSLFVKANFQTIFPIATFLSNFISCIMLGIAVGMFSEKISGSSELKSLIVIGFCGGFSTLSAFSFETVELIRSGNIGYAIANILISVAACTAIVFFLTRPAQA